MVLEKRDGLPVFKIQNLRKKKDIRVVHRNKIMKCDELPLDTFDDKVVVQPKKKTNHGNRKAPQKQAQDEQQEVPDVSEENDTDHVDDEYILVEQVILSDSGENGSTDAVVGSDSGNVEGVELSEVEEAGENSGGRDQVAEAVEEEGSVAESEASSDFQIL